mgnify:CR=1 FL=1
MSSKDVRQINWRATPPTADLLDLAILVRQTVDADPTFTVKKAAEEAVRAWAVEQLAAHPDIAARSAVGLTLGAATATRDLPALTQYLRDNDLTTIAETLDTLTDPAAGYTPPTGPSTTQEAGESMGNGSRKR